MKASYLKPLLPLRDIVIFPSMVVPLFVGREKSIKALQEVMKSDKSIVLVTQKNSEIDDPTGKDLFQFGCMSKVLQLLKLPDGTVKVLVEGEKRVKILKHNENVESFLTCEVEVVSLPFCGTLTIVVSFHVSDRNGREYSNIESVAGSISHFTANLV